MGAGHVCENALQLTAGAVTQITFYRPYLYSRRFWPGTSMQLRVMPGMFSHENYDIYLFLIIVNNGEWLI